MNTPTTLIAGNWKMNGMRADLAELAAIADFLDANKPDMDVAICPPATLAGLAIEAMQGRALKIGGQDCHTANKGAFTGDVAADAWADLGADYVIVGHSERREYHGETNQTVLEKATAVIRSGLVPIICIGESLAEREAGKTLDVLGDQVLGCTPEDAKTARIVIAYEPVWAIGTGHTPTIEEIDQAHTFIRKCLQDKIGQTAFLTPLLYGGSMKPANAAEILAVKDVNGGLVGGASLKADDFTKIIAAA